MCGPGIEIEWLMEEDNENNKKKKKKRKTKR